VSSNVTVYSSKTAAVISVTNLVKNVNNYVNTTSARKTSLDSMVLVTKKNITMIAAGINVYNSVSVPNSVVNNVVNRATSGNLISIMVVSSSVNDSLLSRVQYGFNVSKRLLAAKNITAQAVRLYRRNATSGKWTALPTNIISSNSTQYFFSAASPGMSIYAIGFGYLATNITTNSTAVMPKPVPGSTFVPPIAVIVVILLVFVAALAIIYLTIFRRERQDYPPEGSIPPYNPPEIGIPPAAPPA
jgi:PGF-pre-PGF domain-containing protein